MTTISLQRILLIATTFISFSFDLPYAEAFFKARSRKENYVTWNSFKPPGTVKINEKLYCDETEIRNVDWRAYCDWQLKNFGITSVEYKTSLPDTLVWQDSLSFNTPYVKYYFRHPAYSDFPVVGIKYEQAVAFCKWRTDRLQEFLELKKGGKSNTIHKKFLYRLPSRSEWEALAKVGYDAKTLKKFEKKYAEQIRCNLRQTSMKVVADAKGAYPDITTPVYSYWPDSLGIYNMIGNVAELISEKGIAKGGSWMDNENEVTIEKDFKYNDAKSWLGFRCVFEIIEE